MSSRSAGSRPRSPQDYSRRLRAGTVVTGVIGALTLGQAGIAAAAPVRHPATPGHPAPHGHAAPHHATPHHATPLHAAPLHAAAARGWAAPTSKRHVVRTAPVRRSPVTTRTPEAVVRYGHWAFPSAVRLANGSLLVVYREGPNHYTGRDGFIRSMTSTDQGTTWRAPVTVIPTAPGIDYRDPSISTSIDGATLYLTYFKATTWNSAAGSYFRSSTNGGATWTAEVRIDPKFPSSAISAPAVQLVDGSLATVHYSKQAGESRASVWWSRSTDNGASWTTTRLVDGQLAQRDYQEPYLIRRGADLFLTFRWDHDDSIGSMSSADSGATWSTAAPDFPGSGRPSSVWLADGSIVVYLRDPAGNFDVRVTSDEGATWTPAHLVQAPPPGGLSTYASFVEISPGTVFTVMTAEDSTGMRSQISFTRLSDWTAPGGPLSTAATLPRR